MWVIDMINSFKKDTWVNIFKAIEDEWILLWMWFISTELELTKIILKDLTYKDKVEELKQVYIKRDVRKKYSLTDREVENAIKQSLQNSILWVTAFRKECRYSEWLLNDGEAKNICQKYDNVLNPLYYMITTSGTTLVRSLFADDNLWLMNFWVKNWYTKKGLQRYRTNIHLAKKWIYYVMGSDKVLKNIYHPIVWYLLSINWLTTYLTFEFKKELKVFLGELNKKQAISLNKNKKEWWIIKKNSTQRYE